MSLVIATGILAIGGLGLFMYKNSDGPEKDDESYDENSLFGEKGLFGEGGFFGGSDDVEPELEEDTEYEPDFYEPKPKGRGGKTKRTRKTSGTKRRY